MLFLFFAERLDIPARVLAFRSEARFVRFVKRLVDFREPFFRFLRRGACGFRPRIAAKSSFCDCVSLRFAAVRRADK
jgi:hypothetical protein